jgi:predicted enzyme related to lactoylglutathione lyase
MVGRMAESRTYPHGVPSWIETEQPDPAAARAFYGELFGWVYEDRPGGYAIARLGGREAAGLIEAGRQPGGEGAGWTTYLAVDDADATAKRVTEAGGRILAEPQDVGPGPASSGLRSEESGATGATREGDASEARGPRERSERIGHGAAGRSALCVDPLGARFGLWQARMRLGVQATNEPGAWNFANLHTSDAERSVGFYTSVFGWSVDDIGFGRMIRVPGYGDHLASTVDPTIHERQSGAGAPPGFADAVGWLVPGQDEPVRWHTIFTVADRDASTAIVERSGGTTVSSEDTQWSRTAVVRDPWGAEFAVSQFTPPDNG